MEYPKAHQRLKDKKKIVVHIHNGILFRHEKRGYPSICNNMDRPWAGYANQDKSDRERQVLYEIPYMSKLKKLNL